MQDKGIGTIQLVDNSKVSGSQAVSRQAGLSLMKYQQTINEASTLTLIHHNTNTEALPAHVTDIKSHHQLTVLYFTETHLSGSFVAESLQLEGYNMFKRNRHLSYTNHTHIAQGATLPDAQTTSTGSFWRKGAAALLRAPNICHWSKSITNLKH